MDSIGVAEGGEPNDRKLGDIYADAIKLYDELDNYAGAFNESDVQVKIKRCIKQLEEITNLVSISGLFSSNESHDEVATENLQYFMLPFYLGRLTTKLCASDRKNLVDVADIYFKDFLKRCEDYELCTENAETSLEVHNGSRAASELAQMARQRYHKIELFKQKKELNEQIKQMRELIERDTVDEDIRREFQIKILKHSIMESKEEIQGLSQEKEILEYKGNLTEPLDSRRPSQRPPPPPRPLRPVIITKDAAQKAVFGLGYPSLPTMTVSEFYDQRVREGIFPDPTKALQSVQAGDMVSAEREEEYQLKEEEGEEQDDEEYLARARARDEFKDNVRRGDGNRHNRS